MLLSQVQSCEQTQIRISQAEEKLNLCEVMTATVFSSFVYSVLLFWTFTAVSVDSFSPSCLARKTCFQGLPIRSFSLKDGQISPTTEINGVSNVLVDFLRDSRDLGAVRFVVVGAGAILETIGSFENMRFSETVKGSLVTFSSDRPVFECHIRLSQVKEVQNVVVEKFEKKLRITRFLGKT